MRPTLRLSIVVLALGVLSVGCGDEPSPVGPAPVVTSPGTGNAHYAS
jgi:hypothetical protein